MPTLTKTAAEIFAGFTAGGVPRRIDNNDAVVWGSEIEGILDAFTGPYLASSDADITAPLNALLGASNYAIVPYRSGTATISSSVTVAANKTLEIADGTELAFSGSGNIVLGNNAAFITKTGGADKETWVWARNRAGVHATGGDVTDLGYGGAAFHFDVRSDTMDVGTDFSRGINGRLVFGGSAAKGGRVAVIGQVYHQNAATNSTNAQRYYAGVIGDAHAQVTDGGTGTTIATAKGAYFGLAGHVYGSVASGNHSGLVGCELNVSNITGASQAYVATLTLANSQATRGAVADAFIMISGLDNVAAGFGNHLGNKHGILFTNINGKDPFASDSILIGWYWTGGGARAIQTGIDLSGFAISNNILQGQRLAISESVLTLGNATGSEVEINAANGTTNAAIRIKAKGTGDIILETTGTGALRLPVLYSAGTATTTGNLIVKDSAGTAYRIPCWAA